MNEQNLETLIPGTLINYQETKKNISFDHVQENGAVNSYAANRTTIPDNGRYLLMSRENKSIGLYAEGKDSFSGININGEQYAFK